jgi:hypothetical protein
MSLPSLSPSSLSVSGSSLSVSGSSLSVSCSSLSVAGSSPSVAGSSLSPVFAEGRVEQFEKKRHLLASFVKVNSPFTIYIIYVCTNKVGTFCTTFPLHDITYIPNFVRFKNKSPNEATVKNRLLKKRPLVSKYKIIQSRKQKKDSDSRGESRDAVGSRV